MLRADNILLLLTHHWARDISTFPIEDQCLALATIMLLSIYIGCRPAEIVDASKTRLMAREEAESNQTSCKSTDDDSDKERTYPKPDDSDDPDYNQEDPWCDPKNREYRDDDLQSDGPSRKYKALCYKDIRL